MILPAEADDALDALHTARTRLGHAVDALNSLPAHADTIAVTASVQDDDEDDPKLRHLRLVKGKA